jgi:hypothetical protein
MRTKQEEKTFNKNKNISLRVDANILIKVNDCQNLMSCVPIRPKKS